MILCPPPRPTTRNAATPRISDHPVEWPWTGFSSPRALHESRLVTLWSRSVSVVVPVNRKYLAAGLESRGAWYRADWSAPVCAA